MIDLRACLIAVVVTLGLAGPALAFRNAAVDSPVPALTLDGAGGRRVAVPAPGRPMVLLFWRPGQAFSEEALADLEALAAALSAKGVTIVALAETGSGAGRGRSPPCIGCRNRPRGWPHRESAGRRDRHRAQSDERRCLRAAL